MTLSRRRFLAGCSGAIAALSGAWVSHLAFAEPAPANAGDILVSIFLRGGIDGLNLVVPHGDPHYAVNRPTLRVAPPGRTRGALDLNGFFGLHPAAAPLLTVWNAKHLAIIVATGLTNPTRSHFDAMAMMERGTPGHKSLATGWITRHLTTAGTTASNGGAPPLTALTTSATLPDAVLGLHETAAVPSFQALDYTGRWDQIDFQRIAVRELYGGDHWIQRAGIQALDVVDRVVARLPDRYTPANGARYPSGAFGQSLQVVAQAIKLDLGLRVACVDFGGWDTHEEQGGDGEGLFAALVGALAGGLSAFLTDLADWSERLTVVVMSEFGRQLRENQSRGTDHGHGNVMLVLGGGIIGGIYGRWPGLEREALFEQQDLAITTDYRHVLGEIVVRRLKNPRLTDVFPGMPPYAPLGFARGTDSPNSPPATAAPSPAAPALNAPRVYIPIAGR
ncbi:MAG: DUF1501 domain-containing protein [Chloroflexota bacterium]|nr:DUF1501 domain-containing protein [Dehalococcoidia bacterium]MDW8255155.1 DUF1501 domain-containing protein [Chloroflexota bacterium]